MPKKSTKQESGAAKWQASLVAAGGEFIGTFLFLFFGLAGIQAARSASAAQGQGNQTGGSPAQAVTIQDPSYLLMAATAMAMSLIFAIWIFFRATGAAFNPNIALTLMLVGVITPVRFVLYVVAQLLGAIAAAGVLYGILPGTLNVSTSPSSGTGVAQALFFEMFLTFGLCMTVLLVAIEKNKSTPLAPLAIGFALFATQLAGINFTGAAVNTARAFGPAVVTGDFPGSHWIYWLGPSLGAVLAAGLHRLMKMVHYWELNPGSDATSAKEEADAQPDDPNDTRV